MTILIIVSGKKGDCKYKITETADLFEFWYLNGAFKLIEKKFLNLKIKIMKSSTVTPNLMKVDS